MLTPDNLPWIKKTALILTFTTLSFLILGLVSIQVSGGGPVSNGDANGDGEIDITDAIHLLQWLFTGGPKPKEIECPEGLLATGQVRCHDSSGQEVDCGGAEAAGQDGFYRAGCAGPDGARFLDNGDGTLTDSCTGLMWRRDSGNQLSRPWLEALQLGESLILCPDGAWVTSPDQAASHGGVKYDDWRLPNARELESILDYDKTDPAVPAGFTIQSAGHWSSTSFAGDPVEAWCIHTFDGQAQPISKAAKLQVIVVRSGR